MKNRKGAQIAVLTISVLALLTTGTVFTSMLGTEEIQRSVSFAFDDLNVVSEAKLKEEMYRFNMKKELQYSENIVALNKEKQEFGEDPPDYEQIKQKHVGEVLEELRTQNRVKECKPPEIGGLQLNNNEDKEFTITYPDEEWLNCASTKTVASFKIEELEKSHPKNRYLQLMEEALKIEDKDALPDEEWKETEKEDVICKSDTEELKEDLKDDLPSGGGVESSLANEDWPDGISVESMSVSTSINTNDNHDKEKTAGPHDDGDDCNRDETYYIDYEATAKVTKLHISFTLKDKEKKVLNSQADREPITVDYSYTYNMP